VSLELSRTSRVFFVRKLRCQWEVIQDYVPVLKPHASMTEKLSGENHHLKSKIMALVSGVHISVQQKRPWTENEVRFSNSHVIEGLYYRMLCCVE
jgi:hypothetical protein